MEHEILKQGYLEFSSSVAESKLSVTHDQLLRVAESSQIHTFGWPIGIVLNRDPYRPKPYKEGIKATIHIQEPDRNTFDFWSLRTNGDFYLIKSLFEDLRSQNKFFLDTRIIRITETFLYVSRLYTRLGIAPTQVVNMTMKHGGLKGRELTAANPMRAFFISQKRISEENEIETQFSEKLEDIEKKITDIVYKAVCDITMMFDFFTPSKDEIVDKLVTNFIAGKIE